MGGAALRVIGQSQKVESLSKSYCYDNRLFTREGNILMPTEVAVRLYKVISDAWDGNALDGECLERAFIPNLQEPGRDNIDKVLVQASGIPSERWERLSLLGYEIGQAIKTAGELSMGVQVVGCIAKGQVLYDFGAKELLRY